MTRPLRRAVLVIVLATLAWLAARSVNWRATLSILGNASLPLVLLAAGATLSSTLLKGVRWWLFLRRHTALRLGHVVRLTIAGTGLNSLLIANAGDVARVAIASRIANTTVLVILGSLASDKVMDVAAFLTLTIGAALVTPHVLRSGVGLSIVTVLLVIFAIGLLLTRGLASGILTNAVGRRGVLWRSADYSRRLIAQSRASLTGSDAAFAYALSLLSWGAQVLTYTLGARALGAHLPFRGAMAAVVAVNIAGVLRATPGNVGVFQVMYVLAVLPYGVERATAVGAALLIQAIQMVSASAAAAGVLTATSGAAVGSRK